MEPPNHQQCQRAGAGRILEGELSYFSCSIHYNLEVSLRGFELRAPGRPPVDWLANAGGAL